MSTIKVNTIQNASGTEVYTSKAWVNFNGTGTVAIRGSGNVSSITDNGQGNYNVNFTTAMTDTNCAIIMSQGETTNNTNERECHGYILSTSSARIYTVGGSSSYESSDATYIHASVFR